MEVHVLYAIFVIIAFFIPAALTVGMWAQRSSLFLFQVYVLVVIFVIITTPGAAVATWRYMSAVRPSVAWRSCGLGTYGKYDVDSVGEVVIGTSGKVQYVLVGEIRYTSAQVPQFPINFLLFTISQELRVTLDGCMRSGRREPSKMISLSVAMLSFWRMAVFVLLRAFVHHGLYSQISKSSWDCRKPCSTGSRQPSFSTSSNRTCNECFSSDLDEVGDKVPQSMLGFLQTLFMVISAVVASALSSPYW